MGAGVEHDVLAAQTEKFGGAQTGLHGKQQQCSIATPAPSVEVGRRQQSGHFGRSEKVDRPPRIALARHGEYPLRQGAVLGCVQRHVAERIMDSGEADVATAGAIVAFLFQMIEEGAEERSVQIGQRRARALAKLSLRILQQ